MDYRYNLLRKTIDARLLSLQSVTMIINKERIFFLTITHNDFRIVIDSAGKRGQLRTRAVAESTAEIKVAVKKASQSYDSILHAGFSHRFGYNAPRC